MVFWSGANAQTTFTSTASGGDWNVGTTWVGGTAPGSGDDVVIVNEATVKLTAATTVRNFTIDDGGIFDYDGFVLTLSGTVSPPFVSQASGDWSVSATWLGSPGTTPTIGDKVIINRDHTINLTGSIQVATLIINSGGTLDDDNTGSLRKSVV